MTELQDLRIKVFADGADVEDIRALSANPLIRGFTTNPTLMRKAGVDDYKTFAQAVLAVVPDRPVSFEVLADEFDEMERQALEIASWGENVNVKIPITNTRGRSSVGLIERLSNQGVSVNVTAVFTLDQTRAVVQALSEHVPAKISFFAGRIADTGVDPVPVVRDALRIIDQNPNAELIWASPRELLNIFQADAIGCHIITVTHDILKKLHLINKDLDEYSLETVGMFFNDASAAGYTIDD